MRVNGTADPALDMWFAIGAGDVDFKSDDLPLTFPMTGETQEEFDCSNGYCVTFSVSDANGTLLMELSSLLQVPTKAKK